MSLQVETLEQSFEKVKPYANEFVEGFYENLFTQSPEAKPLFAHTNMAKQKKMVSSTDASDRTQLSKTRPKTGRLNLHRLRQAHLQHMWTLLLSRILS